MHRVTTSIRRIDPAEMAGISDQELLNRGLVPLGNDLYSCITQEERDPDSLAWQPKDGQTLPGTVIRQGLLEERHAKLPTAIKPLVMRARILKDGKRLASESLAALAAELLESVGSVEGAPLIDTESPEAIAAEARRLAEVPGSGVSRGLVPMADVTQDDLTEAEGLIPHSWAGEPRK